MTADKKFGLVLQPWLTSISLMQQTVLLTALKSGDWWPVDGAPIARIGKKRAGRQLDFKEHHGLPELREVQAP